MKGKTPSAILTVLMALGLLTIRVQSTSTAEMYFDPTTIDGTLDIGDTFDIAVIIKDFTTLYTWQVEVTWNKDVLTCNGYTGPPDITDDIFDLLASGVTTLWYPGTIDNAAGIFTYSAYSLTGPTGVTGAPGVSYKMVVLHFRVAGHGTSPIHYNKPGVNTLWLKPTGPAQPCIYTDGEAITKAPPVGGVWVPVDKVGLLAPYIGLASTILVATAATAIYVKRVKRRKKQ